MAGFFGYKKLLSEKNFLKVQERARQLMKDGTQIVSILYKDKEIVCKTHSASEPIYYTQRIQITDAGLESLLRAKSFKDIEKIMKESGLKVYCSCLYKNTEVLTDKGYKKITDIQPGDMVLSSDLNYYPVLSVRKSEPKSNWVRLGYNGVRSMIITTDHKIKFSVNNKKFFATLEEFMQHNPAWPMLGYFVDRMHRVCIEDYVKLSMTEPGYDVVLADGPHDYVANGVFVSNCPAFLYWGFAYKSWKLGYGLKKELRVPKVRNPQQRGYVCFPEGQNVLTSEGYKDIKDVQIGDLVYTHKGRLRRVTDKGSRVVDRLHKILVGDVVICSTVDHPFLVQKCDSLHEEFIKAADIKEGDCLFKLDVTHGWLRPVLVYNSFSFYAGDTVVYSISVEEDETYIVQDCVVHNCKHLYLVLSAYPFWAKTLASKFNKWARNETH